MTYVNGKYQGDGFSQVSSHYKVQHRQVGLDDPWAVIDICSRWPPPALALVYMS